MSCFHPLPAYVDRQKGGQPRIGYNAGGLSDKLELPCGRCIGCKMDRSRAWSIRVMHEAQLYDSNLFLTLDYAPEHLPRSLSLEYRDFQGFMKRVRKSVRGVNASPNGGYPVRFFCSGEYGERFGRPHWHAILFNCDFPDKVRYVNGTYRSAEAESLWGRGNVVIGSVTPRSAAYCAGYTLSKVYGSAAEDFYEDVVNRETGEVSRRRPEFCTMSRRPGIGAWWYEKYGGDLLPHDFAIMEGSKYKVPRFYWNKFQDQADPFLVEEIAHARFLRAQAVDPSENTEERRLQRKAVVEARTKMFSSRGVSL